MRALRALARLLIRSEDAPFILSDLEEHLERDLVRGVPPVRARARYAFNLLGSAVAVWRARLSGGRGGGASWLDFKLGLRMLLRYPGLSVVGGLAMAFAIAIGAAFFEFVTQFANPRLPLEEGDRIVALRNWDVARGERDAPSLHDFVLWRESLESVEQLGATRTVVRNLITDDGRGEPVQIAEISGSAFSLTRVPPLLGRTLLPSDEQQGPSVVVFGYDVWQARFGGAADVIGRTVSVGGAAATVVGVMPEGYAFPLYHGVWIPLRMNPLDYGPGQAPTLGAVFGRLAPGSSFAEAQAELDQVGLRSAADSPETHARLRPQVIPYPRSFFEMSGLLTAAVLSRNLLLVLLLVRVCANVALLMFARAAARERELVVRSALGATRSRIVGQLFVEALVLGSVAAAIGLATASWVLRWGLGAMMSIEELPFWFSDRLAPATVVYGALLAVLGAAVAGVIPGLKATGRRVEGALRKAAVGGQPMRFGGVWAAVIVTQIALTVAVPVHAYFVTRQAFRFESLELPVAKGRYLSVRVEHDPRAAAQAAAGDQGAAGAFRETVTELSRRVAAEPGVLGVTFADRASVVELERRRVQVDGLAVPEPAQREEPIAGPVQVAADYFEVLGLDVRAGRDFRPSDAGTPAVIVNQAFVEQVLAGRSALGQRVRYVPRDATPDEPSAEARWYEILGVVSDFAVPSTATLRRAARLYHPIEPTSSWPIYMLVNTAGASDTFAHRLRAVAAAVDPTLQLHELMPLEDVSRGALRWMSFLSRITLLIGGIALLLSLAGIYSVMSFTVARRQREIGVRVALGASSGRVASAIFRQPLTQVGVGLTAGSVIAALLAAVEFAQLEGGTPTPGAVAAGGLLLAGYAALMVAVCLLACVVPTLRALRVQPTEALRAEG